ncbi:MAG: SCO family protein [Halopseudomonas aestusnigri]
MTTRLIFPLLAALLGGGFLWQSTDGLRAITTEEARRISVAENPRPVPEAYLEAMDGTSVALLPQHNETVLVEFIYTSCGDICQVAALDFSEIRDQLALENADVRMISISFDPEQDTPDKLSYYGEAHNADGTLWTVARPISLSGETSLSDLLNLFGVTVIANEWGGFEHNTAIHMIDENGQFSQVFDIDDVDQVVTTVLERS